MRHRGRSRPRAILSRIPGRPRQPSSGQPEREAQPPVSMAGVRQKEVAAARKMIASGTIESDRAFDVAVERVGAEILGPEFGPRSMVCRKCGTPLIASGKNRICTGECHMPDSC